jgi:hypothetical protein
VAGKVGRPRKVDKYGGHIARAEDLIADRLPDLVENLFRLAEGVEVQKADRTGKPYVYSQPPDREANVYLINRILGKPKERIEHSGDDGGPLQAEVISGASTHELNALSTLLARLVERGAGEPETPG